MRSRILVTGGTGFIGRHLAAGLASHVDVLAPPRRELDLLDDASVRRWLEAHPVEAIVHAATTPAHRNAPAQGAVAYKNLRMFHNLLAAPGWKRMIYLGSGSEMDARAYQPKMREDRLGASVPEDESGLSKYAIAVHCERDPRCLNLRLFGVYGPGEDWEIRFVSNAICKALFGKAITLRQNRRFDYLWVEDLLPVVREHLLRDAPYRACNVTPDSSIELLALAELVRDACEARTKTRVEIRVTNPGLGPEYSGDNARLRAAMPGVSFTPHREAVARLCRWYDEHRDRIRPEALEVDK